MTRLMRTNSITFTRYGDDTDKTYVDDYGNTVAPTTITTIETCGSLQPISKKQNRVGNEEGFREEDHLVYYTTSELRTIEQFDNFTADTCEIDGKHYKVTRRGNWTGFGLRTDHNEYFLQLIQPKGS